MQRSRHPVAFGSWAATLRRGLHRHRLERRRRGAGRLGTWAVAAAALVASSTACASDEVQVSHPGIGRRAHGYAFPVTAEAALSLSASRLQDWVTYADAVGVISVDRQAEVAPSSDELSRGEGVIGRRLTVRTAVLWRRAGAPLPPPSFTFDSRGWFFTGRQRRPVVFEDGRWLEVGQRYVVPLVRFAATGWGVLDDGAVPVVGDRLVASGATPANPLVARLRGDRLAQVRGILTATPPDPRAAAFRGLDPVARFRMVHGEGEGVPAS